MVTAFSRDKDQTSPGEEDLEISMMKTGQLGRF